LSMVTDRIARQSTRRREVLLGYALILPALLLVMVILVYPTLFNLDLSIREWSWSSPAGAPKPFVGLQNFVTLFQSDRFWNSMKVSLFLVVIGLTLEYALGLSLALLLNQKFRARRIFRSIFVLPMMLAPIVVGLQWRYLLSGNFGVVNYVLGQMGVDPPSWLSQPAWALPVLLFVGIWTYVPFMALILLAGLQQVPLEVYEAAAIDGAGPFARFRLITMPFLRSSTAIALLLRGAEIFRTFDVVYVMTGGGPGRATEVSGMFLYRLSFGEGNFGEAAALALIIALIGILIGSVVVKAIRTEVRLF
jgi:multiple sugar transport system permease protein